MITLSIAYMFTCLGFCLGFVACSILRTDSPGPEGMRVQCANRRATPAATHGRPTAGRIEAHTERKPGAALTPTCACGYLRCVCPTGTPR